MIGRVTEEVGREGGIGRKEGKKDRSLDRKDAGREGGRKRGKDRDGSNQLKSYAIYSSLDGCDSAPQDT